MKRLIELLPHLKRVKRVWGSDTAPVGGFSSDSRTVTAGDVFFAIRGGNQDGRRYIPQALERGASVIVSDSGFPDADMRDRENCAFVETDDLSLFMAEIAAVYYQTAQKSMQLIGITGTNGKTTTAHVINEIWKRLNIQPVFIGTTGIEIAGRHFHTDYTTPPSYEIHRILHEGWEQGVRHAVMEVSSHALKLRRVDGLRYQAAAFTNLTHEHGEIHPTMEDYYQTKKRLFSMLDDTGFAVINTDDDYGKRMLEDMRDSVECYDYGHTAVDAKILNITVSEDHSFQEAAVRMDNQTIGFKSPIIGSYNAMNVLCALQLLYRLGYSLGELLRWVSDIPPPPGRMEWYKAGNINVIVDFAHTPDGLEKLLSSVAVLKKQNQRLITVFGCPGDRDRTKRPVMGRIAAGYSDMVIVTTDDVHHENPEQIIGDILQGSDPKRTLSLIDRREAIHTALTIANPGDFIVIAGRGHERFQYVGDDKVPFVDAEVLKEEASKTGLSVVHK